MSEQYCGKHDFYYNINHIIDVICPWCEIDRLKEELEDSKRYGTSKFIECSEWIEKVQDLQDQLAEARAENKRLKDNLSDAYDDHCDSH